MELELVLDGPSEAPLFRSRFGGLWVDRSDAHTILAERRAQGEITPSEAKALAQFIDEGYVVFPRATDPRVIDEYLDLFERSWDEAPPVIYAHVRGETRHLSRQDYDEIAKVSCLHCCFANAGELIFPPPVLRFLELLYDRPPVAFQTMTMRKGSEESLHIDTGPLTLSEPMSLAAAWVALEDVKPHSGEFEFVPGSHRLPEHVHHGVSKGHQGDMSAYGNVLHRLLETCAERGLKTERFQAKKGDVLIWHADLLHGGAKIEDPKQTRNSLVTHFMPLGVFPTFYDSSMVKALPYPGGGYCLDRLLSTSKVSAESPVENFQPATTASATASNGQSDLISRMKRRVPLPVRAFAREQVDWLTTNPRLSRERRS
jgi:phytanoyl-CoA hydroxylase